MNREAAELRQRAFSAGSRLNRSIAEARPQGKRWAAAQRDRSILKLKARKIVGTMASRGQETIPEIEGIPPEWVGMELGPLKLADAQKDAVEALLAEVTYRRDDALVDWTVSKKAIDAHDRQLNVIQSLMRQDAQEDEITSRLAGDPGD